MEHLVEDWTHNGAARDNDGNAQLQDGQEVGHYTRVRGVGKA